MTKSIDQLVDEVIGREGDYSNHPADRGGPTRWGITEQVARAYGYGGDMKVLPRTAAVAIYKRRYWTDVRFDQVAAIYPRVAAEMFDTGINMGQAVAATFLQRALNVLNRGGAIDYPDTSPDGQIGAMTIAALKGYRQTRAATGIDEAVLLKAIDALQGNRYVEITEARPANEAFTFGWFANRIGQPT